MNNDLFKQVRSTMIGNMQNSMRRIRKVMHMNEGYFGSLIGLSAAEVKKLEENQETMTETQYIAMCSLIDYKMSNDENLHEVMKRLLQIEDKSLVESWFLFFDEEMEEHPILKDGQELNEDALKMIANDYKVFIHYDSLKLCKNNKPFNSFLNALKSSNQTLIVPECVVNKLQNDMLSYNLKSGSEARSALSVLNRLMTNQVIEMQKDVCNGTVEEKIRQLFCNGKRNFQMILITENESLARDLQTLNEKMDGFDSKVITMHGNTMKLYRNLLVEETPSAEEQTGWDF